MKRYSSGTLMGEAEEASVDAAVNPYECESRLAYGKLLLSLTHAVPMLDPEQPGHSLPSADMGSLAVNMFPGTGTPFDTSDTSAHMFHPRLRW